MASLSLGNTPSLLELRVPTGRRQWKAADTKGFRGQAQAEVFPRETEEPSKDGDLERGMVFSKTTEVSEKTHPAAAFRKQGPDRFWGCWRARVRHCPGGKL